MRPVVLLIAAALAFASAASAAPLTAEEAVRLALQKNGAVIQSEAGALSARGGLWSAYSQVLPSLSGSVDRGGSFTGSSSGKQVFGSQVFPSSSFDSERYSGSYGLSGRWSVFDPSAIVGLSSARQSMKGAELSQRATRADVRLETNRRFFSVVKAMHLSGVSSRSLKLSRDDERRVRALFEVGSVSKSDLLKAQVRTAQSQLDSLLTDHAVITQRIALAQQLGTSEGQLGEVDSTLAADPRPFEPVSVLAEARRQRPDLLAAEAELKSAELGLRSAHWSRLPSLALSGAWTPKSTSAQKLFGDKAHTTTSSGASETKDSWQGQVSVNLNLFDGFATDARVASARAQLLRSRETRDALLRNLEGEVRQTLLVYQEGTEREALARRTVASAAENLNLVQQKYNVGSATILDLIDSQVQLQRAQSDLVSALADIRVAEAAVDRVRGQGE